MATVTQYVLPQESEVRKRWMFLNLPCFISYQKYNTNRKNQKATASERNELNVICNYYLREDSNVVHDMGNIYFCLFSFNPHNYSMKSREHIQLSSPCKAGLPEATWWYSPCLWPITHERFDFLFSLHGCQWWPEANAS